MKKHSILHATIATIAMLFTQIPVIAGNALSWEKTIVEVDAEIGQGEVNAYYPFTNTSDSSITITNSTASCGCTVPSLEKTLTLRAKPVSCSPLSISGVASARSTKRSPWKSKKLAAPKATSSP